jgi:hypothetical protein
LDNLVKTTKSNLRFNATVHGFIYMSETQLYHKWNKGISEVFTLSHLFLAESVESTRNFLAFLADH